MTVLGDKQRAAAVPAKPSRFAAALAGKRVLEPVTVLGLDGVMTLIGHGTVQEIEGAVYKRMAELGVELGPLTASTFESERAVRTLAEAVRQADDPSKALGTLEEWQQVDLDTVALLWLAYGDLRERQDPVSAPLTKAEHDTITTAIEKKNAPLLRSCGARALATWLLSTDGQPATSPSPSSGSSASSPAS